MRIHRNAKTTPAARAALVHRVLPRGLDLCRDGGGLCRECAHGGEVGAPLSRRRYGRAGGRVVAARPGPPPNAGRAS